MNVNRKQEVEYTQNNLQKYLSFGTKRLETMKKDSIPVNKGNTCQSTIECVEDGYYSTTMDIEMKQCLIPGGWHQ